MMLSAPIAPHQAIHIPYSFPPNSAIKLQVFATQPVDVYMVTFEGLAAFATTGTPEPAWIKSIGRTAHAIGRVLPPQPQWNLLIVNPSDASVTVNYDVTIEGYGFGPTGFGSSGSTGPYR
ncbi:MAG TPA: hypothetical protein VIX35_08455 [Vicinamibacterales bacterium]